MSKKINKLIKNSLKDEFEHYVDFPLNQEAYLTNDNATVDGFPVEGYKNGDKVKINTIRIFPYKKPVYFIDGTIHGWRHNAFSLLKQNSN
jgi:hypothetical protein